MPDDAPLLLRYVSEHSEIAFAELVARHVDLVYSAALRQLGGDPHLAQDVTQQVFTTLARKAPQLTRHPALGGWLYTTTLHIARRALRADVRRRTRETEAWHMSHHKEPGAAAWEGIRPILDDAMRDLGDREREAVVLRFFSQLPFAELGRSLGVSEDAARMRVDRALDRLRRALASRGVTSTAAALSLLLTAQSVSAAPAGLATTVTGSALASAASTTSTTASFLSFMSTTKFAAAATAVLLTALGTAYYEHHQRTLAQEILATVQAAQARQVAALHTEEDRAKTTEQELARAESALEIARLAATAARARAQATAAASTASTLAASAAPPLTAAEEGVAFASRHPEVKRALADYGSASQRFRYAPMYRALNFTPEQIRLWESMASGSMGSSLSDGRAMSLPVGERLTSDERTRRNNELFGDSAASRLSEFNAIGYARIAAADVAGSLYFTATPLAPEQADFLVQLLVQNKNSGATARISDYNWDAIVTQASGQLTAPQLAVLSARRAGDQFRQFLNRPRSDSAPSTPGK